MYYVKCRCAQCPAIFQIRINKFAIDPQQDPVFRGESHYITLDAPLWYFTGSDMRNTSR